MILGLKNNKKNKNKQKYLEEIITAKLDLLQSSNPILKHRDGVVQMKLREKQSLRDKFLDERGSEKRILKNVNGGKDRINLFSEEKYETNYSRMGHRNFFDDGNAENQETQLPESLENSSSNINSRSDTRSKTRRGRKRILTIKINEFLLYVFQKEKDFEEYENYNLQEKSKINTRLNDDWQESFERKMTAKINKLVTEQVQKAINIDFHEFDERLSYMEERQNDFQKVIYK